MTGVIHSTANRTGKGAGTALQTITNVLSLTTLRSNNITISNHKNNISNNDNNYSNNNHRTAHHENNDGNALNERYPRVFNKVVFTLENSLIPEDKLNVTPSFRDGLDQETEMDLRILGCELIQTAGILLRLPQEAMATGQVLFQRFFYAKSFVRHNMETVAMSCVCLASKIEETPRCIRDVINVFHHMKQMRTQTEIKPMVLDHHFTNVKTQVIKAERRVLKELGFCVHVKHPHKLIVLYLQVLQLEEHATLMQIAWNFVNDSLRTDVFVRFTPQSIACACIYLGARKLNILLPHAPPWFGIFQVSMSTITDICYRIMELYTRGKPMIGKLESAVEKLKLKKSYIDATNMKKESYTPPPLISVDCNDGSHTDGAKLLKGATPVNAEMDTRSSHSQGRSASREHNKNSHRDRDRNSEHECNRNE